ncbi:MAG: Bug family tripartite tricarboxylate transporter substrate binding protein [Betaproteobacteria bacterium]
MKQATLAAAFAAITALTSLDALAQPFPSRTIRIIVPFAAGGAADNMARITSERVAQAIGQSITVENLTGAGGNVGAAQVARAEPNGYTLLATIDSVLTINPHVTPKMPFSAIDDFEPLIKLVDVPLYLAAHRSFPGKTLPEALAAAKSKPGQFAIGSSGQGSPHHIAIELLNRSAGVQFAHVPYRGAAQSVADLGGGHIPLAMGAYPALRQFVESGAVVLLATTGPARAPALPNVPSIAETVPGYSVTSWLGFLAPAKTPRPVLERLAAEYAAAARLPEVAERLKQGGMDPAPVSLDEFGKLLRADHARMGKIVRDAAISLN